MSYGCPLWPYCYCVRIYVSTPSPPSTREHAMCHHVRFSAMRQVGGHRVAEPLTSAATPLQQTVSIRLPYRLECIDALEFPRVILRTLPNWRSNSQRNLNTSTEQDSLCVSPWRRKGDGESDATRKHEQPTPGRLQFQRAPQKPRVYINALISSVVYTIF